MLTEAQPAPAPEHPAAAWAARTRFDPVHVDCTTAVMLKILDGKCKMNADEKSVIAVIYDVVWSQPHRLLDPAIHVLISEARRTTDEAVLERVYEQRLYAEQMISRPVMKAYKAWLRAEGLIGAGG